MLITRAEVEGRVADIFHVLAVMRKTAESAPPSADWWEDPCYWPDWYVAEMKKKEAD